MAQLLKMERAQAVYITAGDATYSMETGSQQGKIRRLVPCWKTEEGKLLTVKTGEPIPSWMMLQAIRKKNCEDGTLFIFVNGDKLFYENGEFREPLEKDIILNNLLAMGGI